MNFILATNQKPRIHAHPKQRNSNITLDTVIKSQKRKQKELQKQLAEDNEQNVVMYIPISNYFKC